MIIEDIKDIGDLFDIDIEYIKVNTELYDLYKQKILYLFKTLINNAKNIEDLKLIYEQYHVNDIKELKNFFIEHILINSKSNIKQIINELIEDKLVKL